MRYRVLLAAAGLLAASPSVYGQSKLSGKWQTDNAPAALEALKNAPATPEAGGRGGRGPQAIILDLQADAAGKISGTVNEIGNAPVLTIETGAITGKAITWVTQPRGVTWTLELTDDDTLTIINRGFAGRGGGGGGKGPAPEAAPGGGGGAPPAGGGAPGGDGAPKGGGGRGRGPQQAIVLHRAK